MPTVIYILAILLVCGALCVWFFLSRRKDKRRREQVLGKIGKKEEEVAPQQSFAVEQELKVEEKQPIEPDLQDFVLEKQEEVEEQEEKTANSKKNEPQKVEEKEEEEDDIEARFKEYERFLRERLTAKEDDDEEDVKNSASVAEKRTEEAVPHGKRVNLPPQANQPLPPLVEPSLGEYLEKNGIEEFPDLGSLEVERNDIRRAEIPDDYDFSEDEKKEIESFDMNSVAGKNFVQIANMLEGFSPRVRSFLLTRIMDEM